MQFIHQPLTWGFLLALVPLLIHLINMMRHRRVPWAAMEFLLASYKKHQKWIWLKQLLLLLTRMAAIALVVAMLAGLKTRDQWLAIFGGKVTHHYVLLDDSYSMSDRVAGASAVDAAKQVVAAIVGRAVQEDSPQKLTLLRFSQARTVAPLAGQSGSAPAPIADFNAEPIDSSFELTLERKLQMIDFTQLALGPVESLKAVRQLISEARDETSVVYLLSDFRARDWNSPAELRDSLGQLRRAQADLHLVNCARSSEPNLGIVAIEPGDDTRAAGVPLFVNIKVKNFGARAATKVQLRVQSTFFAPQDLTKTRPDELRGQTDDLATLLLDSIGAGETITRRVQVYFPQPGKHVVHATLPEDPVEADNRHWCVIDFPEGERVLVIDGSNDQQHAYFLEVAFRPLERSNTGIRPEVKQPAFLRDATLETLNTYSAIYLLDVSRLDGRAAETLTNYVQGGGGLGIFVGPSVSSDYYNQALYRDGQGILPAPLALDADLPPALDSSQPDLEFSNHPIFSFFRSETNPLLRGVKINRYRKLQEGWQPGPAQAVEVIARVRDKNPLVLEKRFGQGEVLLFLTTLAPDWNDLAKNPAFVVVILKSQSYLATAKRLDDPRTVGDPLELVLEAARYRSDLSFVTPGEKAAERIRIDRQAKPAPASTPATPGAAPRAESQAPNVETTFVSHQITAQPADGAASAAPGDETGPAAETPADVLFASLGLVRAGGRLRGETDRAGIYEAWPVTTKGEIDLRRWAVNVAPQEGDLTPLSERDLRERLDPVKYEFHQAEGYQQEDLGLGGYNLSLALLTILVVLLLAEQAFSYAASYHVPLGAAR